ncbi:MAG: ABC transporter substrate-binding protein, partial [Actinomycetota bacterium]
MNLSRLRLGAFVLAFGLFAAACGGDDDTATDESSSSASASASSSASESASASGSSSASEPASLEPIIVEHKFGETEVPRDPQRVVSLGVSDQDDLLALGIVPVGILDWYGDQPFAVWPWAQDLLGDAEPLVIPSAEPSPELIAGLDPDLIVAVSSGLTQEQYDLLSQVAPTVASPAGYEDWSAPWQVRTAMIGEIFDRSGETDAMIAQVEDRFEQIRAENPAFDGATAAVAFTFNNQPGAYTSTDVRAQIMGSLGFVTPAEYDELALNGFYVSFSEE